MLETSSFTLHYDSEHDILDIFVGEPVAASSDETAPGILLRHTFDSDELVGVTIMEYSKKTKGFLRYHIPLAIDWKSVEKVIYA